MVDRGAMKGEKVIVSSVGGLADRKRVFLWVDGSKPSGPLLLRYDVLERQLYLDVEAWHFRQLFFCLF